jgi:hypothetical protein
MKKIYRTVSSCLLLFFLLTSNGRAQNNLAAGDIVFSSYQSDEDLTNTDFSGGTTNYVDRFSILILKAGGLAANTVIYFTDNGWNATTGNFISGLSEGFIQWTVPAGGIGFNNRVYFISRYTNGTMTWGAYTDAAGTTAAGSVYNVSGSNYMELSTAGDQVLAYQTGTATGSAGAYNDATRRFLSAVHANKEAGTTNAAWDGTNPYTGHQSSMPTGLTADATAIWLSSAVEWDDGKVTFPAASYTLCQQGLSPLAYATGNWKIQDTAFSDATAATIPNLTITPNDIIITSPVNQSVCTGQGATFITASSNGTNYQWQESTTADFASPVTLSESGLYINTNTRILTISSSFGLGGRYYRSVITNNCGLNYTAPALLTLNSGGLATSYTSVASSSWNNHYYYDGSCKLVARVVPAGANPFTYISKAQVWIENAVPVALGQPFVARHYEVITSNGATGTGTITLYFTQAEFNAFNAAPGSALDLPTGPTDNMGKANLRIGNFAGASGNGSGLPDYYSAPVSVIDPPDGNIVWNATDSRWEVTFDAANQGGFIVQTFASALPLNLLSFSGALNNSDVYLQWQTESEIHHDYFEVERSTDGQTFTAAGRIAGTNGSGTQRYSFVDAGAAQLSNSKLYYRLKMVSTSGDVEYSKIVTISISQAGSPVVSVTPNPFTTTLKIGLQMPEAARLAIRLNDITGKTLKSEYANVTSGYTLLPVTGLEQLTPGVYILSVTCHNRTYTYKLVK